MTSAAAVLRFGRYELRPHERRLLVDGEPVALGSRALDVLIALAERAGQLVTKHQLLDIVWPDVVVEENNLQTQISALRKVLGGEVIATVPGRGYSFTSHVEQAVDVPPGLAVAPSGARVPAGPALKTNLQEALPPLIGRDEDLARLGALVDHQRLVTVVGAGGMGKTRLVQALLHARRATYPHGVCWVELAAANDAAALPGVIAAALGLDPAGRDPLQGLIAAIAPLNLLIALDNAETLLADVARIAAALHATAPDLRLLVTCQAPLKVAAEHVYRLGPLGLPPPGPPSTPLAASEAKEFGAVALFVERAQAADARYTLTDADAPAVIEACRALDGLPLAIELAAARAPMLGAQRLAAALDERLKLLTASRDRAAPARQQTLRAALEWSRSLLDEAERIVFRRLAVFAGSADLELIQQVVTDDRLDEWVALDALCSLVDRSLVAVVDGETPRYRLLESPRALAWEDLAAAAEQDALRRRHARALAARWETAWSARFRGDRTLDEWERALDTDADNARAAFAWACRNDQTIALSIGALLLTRLLGESHSDIARVADALEACIGSQAPLLRARAWHELSMIWGRVSLRRGRDYAQRAVELFRSLQDRVGLYVSLGSLAFVSVQADPAVAQAALAEMRAVEDPTWPPLLLMLGALPESNCASHAGDHERALSHARRMVALHDAAGDSSPMIEINRLEFELAAGNAEVAVRDGIALVQRLLGSRRENSLALARLNLTAAALMSGDLVLARRTATDGWPSAARFGMQAWWADHLALLAALEGRVRSAARLVGFADTVYRRTDDERQNNEASSIKRVRALAIAALGEQEVQRLHAGGAALRDEEVATLGLGAEDA